MLACSLSSCSTHNASISASLSIQYNYFSFSTNFSALIQSVLSFTAFDQCFSVHSVTNTDTDANTDTGTDTTQQQHRTALIFQFLIFHPFSTALIFHQKRHRHRYWHRYRYRRDWHQYLTIDFNKRFNSYKNSAPLAPTRTMVSTVFPLLTRRETSDYGDQFRQAISMHYDDFILDQFQQPCSRQPIATTNSDKRDKW